METKRDDTCCVWVEGHIWFQWEEILKNATAENIEKDDGLIESNCRFACDLFDPIEIEEGSRYLVFLNRHRWDEKTLLCDPGYSFFLIDDDKKVRTSPFWRDISCNDADWRRPDLGGANNEIAGVGTVHEAVINDRIKRIVGKSGKEVYVASLPRFLGAGTVDVKGERYSVCLLKPRRVIGLDNRIGEGKHLTVLISMNVQERLLMLGRQKKERQYYSICGNWSGGSFFIDSIVLFDPDDGRPGESNARVRKS